MAYGSLDLTSSLQDGVFTVKLTGEFDASDVADVNDALATAETADGVREIVLDISELDFVDSSGLGVMVSAAKRSRDDGDRLRITESTPAVERLIRTAGFEGHLPRARAA